MFGKVFVIFVVTATLCVVHACGADDNTQVPKTMMTSENKESDSAELSQTDIMLMCNESFRTSMGTCMTIGHGLRNTHRD